MQLIKLVHVILHVIHILIHELLHALSGKSGASRNPRDIQREVVSDLANFIRRNRMGLPLLSAGPSGKETKAQKTGREGKEEALRLLSEDHVSVFLRQTKKDSGESSDDEDLLADNVDRDEKLHIEQSILDALEDLDDDGDSKEGSSKHDSEDESERDSQADSCTNLEMLDKNGGSTRTEPVNHFTFNALLCDSMVL
jgi:hypothetical protein